jgi:hypothetical protein
MDYLQTPRDVLEQQMHAVNRLKQARARDMLRRARLGGWHAHISLLLVLATTLCIVVPTLASEDQPRGFCKRTDQEGQKFFCDDFSSGTAEQWEPQVGVWTVEDGEYVGEGTFNPTCFGISNDELNGTLIRNLEASAVDVRVDMRSIERVDKGIILRSTGPDNQIELNFRADPFSDLIVQELVDCEFITHLAEFEVMIPHPVGETIHTRVKLIRNHLQVWINGHLERFSGQCRTSPLWANHARASNSVTVASARVTAASSASRVRALAARKNVLIFDQHCSIGFRAGE